MRIVFMGTPDFAVATLERIIRDGHEVAAVVTQPDKPKGRGREVVMSPVKQAALACGIPVLQPEKVRAPQVEEILKEIAPHVIVVVAFGQFLPQAILDLPRHGCVNVHASLLPAYRGAAPIQWAVIDGLEETGVTTMQMDKGMDTGDILMQAKLRLSPKETGGSLFDRLRLLGADLLSDTLKGLEAGIIQPVKQEEEKASYAKILDKAMGNLDFARPADALERLARGLNPWPSAYTRLNGKQLKIWDCEVCESAPGLLPGTVFAVDGQSFAAACGRGALRILEVQLEGKKRMDSAAFLRGNPLKTGVVLGKEDR